MKLHLSTIVMALGVLLCSIAVLSTKCGSSQKITVYKNGVECSATLGPDGKPKNIDCDLGDGGI